MASRAKKKAQQRAEAGPAILHNMLHQRDVKGWGAKTLCGKFASTGTSDHTKVTCEDCASRTNWNAEQYHAACSAPLVLCCLTDKCTCGPNPIKRWRME